MMIARPVDMARLGAALRRSRVVGLVGPRQCGKTTLARQVAARRKLVHYFDLEDPSDLASLDEPMSTLRPLKGLVIIDEVQRRPELFPVLRVLADRVPLPARFLALGSASQGLLRQASESLAGRIELVELSGLSLEAVGASHLDRLWLRGGLPASYVASRVDDSLRWRRQFVQTFLERDLGTFGIRVPAPTLLRFWTMLAHYHCQIWNAAELARSLGVDETTARRYLDLLESFFMVRVLRPWHANIKKRQVKSPKVVFRDSGLLHTLLGIRSEADLRSHPKCGASWEGVIIEETIRRFEPDEVHFWATHGGAELDLVLLRNGRLYGVECKRTDAPRMTASIGDALESLSLERVWIVYPGERRFRIAPRVEVLPAAALGAATSPFHSR